MVKKQIKKIIVKSITIASILTMLTPNIITATRFTKSITSRDPDTTNSTNTENTSNTQSGSGKTVIVLDPGHGKSSGSMSDSEKTAEGFVKNGSGWGEWRHWKNGTYGESCTGSGCVGTHPATGNCWYPIGNGDRATEGPINLRNANAAKNYLEQMGYEVRMTRTSEEQNPSFTKRASYCFPNQDTTQEPDAELYVCIHSNALNGSARGTAYISTGGTYSQKYIPSDYVERSNKAGDMINQKVAATSGLTKRSPIGGEEYLIAFNKNPVPTAYLEIGFFDNSSDLAILNSKYDEIGKAIAEGIDEYLKSVDPLTSGSRGSGTSSGNSTTTASKGKITITSNEKKFLGLWKNSVGYYVPYYQDAEQAKFNPDGMMVQYGNYGYASAGIFQMDYWLFDLLTAGGQRTQQHLQLMKYLMYKYSRERLWRNRVRF